MYKWHSLLIAFLFVTGCGKPLPELEGMDMEAWKSDRNGCLNKRVAMADAIEDQKNKLLTLDEKQMVKLLGKPDQNELYQRNQKFYSYFLTPAPACGGEQPAAKVLIIRFNAMGLAKETVIQ
jgi:hypothetical protein